VTGQERERIMNPDPNPSRRPQGAGESGNALVASLLILMVLTAAGVAYVAVTKSEKQISGNAVIATEAFYNAEAGISEGLYRMSFKKDSLHFIGPSGPETPGWGRYIVRASGASALDPDHVSLASDALDNDADGFIDESGERYPEVLSKQDADAGGMRYPYVRVEYKTQGGQLVRYGDADQNALTPPRENLTYGAPMLRITALGRRGGASKVLEAEAVRFPLMNVESAMWTGSPLSLNGNAFWIDGHDHDMTSLDTIPNAPPVKGILTKGPKSDVAMATNQEDNVTGEGGEASVAQSPFTYDFAAMWSTLSVVAQNAFTGNQTWSSSTPMYGTIAEPAITVVKGNLGVKGTWSGAGILMVDGNLEMQGGSVFRGIVICTGNLALAGGGPADLAHIIGGVIAQGTINTSSSTGGAARVFYSSAAVNNALTLNRYTLAWWRER
jgi:hypothetical protein